ncbi:SEC-C metal-binding domain-containing protein [Aurantimonas marianensis]|uniref:SEC-C domain-containing protein n=1 Tax=Aurantimonas marianensis TaxID=2920428 RepID=A0A9X2KFK2_9HYPH|nr:SEC-C metal-binding domain-containing protein [Aurantimonas marianensis]MCP3056558.1 SEC-C domain-containing protein [Aurantimonas marianensis]
MSGYRRPGTPADVERTLRQEAGFGCAKCGHPYIEYHHIVPFSEEEHFRAADMVALCGNCHPAVAGWGRDRQYEVKKNPHNAKSGIARGALEYDKRNLVFKVGGNWYENTPTILQFHDIPIISCHLEEGQAKISLNIMDDTGRIILSVKDNNIIFRINDLWDFEYRHNLATARYGARDVALKLDFRGQDATIEGKLWLGSQQALLRHDHTTLPGNNVFRGSRITNCGVGIQLGNPGVSPWAATKRNHLCPCGSGKRYKHCHGHPRIL